MSQYDDDRDRYEEEILGIYYWELENAAEMDLKQLCKKINMKKVKREFRDMVKSIKDRAVSTGMISDKQRAVLNFTWAHQETEKSYNSVEE